MVDTAQGGVVDEIIADGPFYNRAHFGDSPDKLDAERITEAGRTSLRDAVVRCTRVVRPSTPRLKSSFASAARRR